MTIQIMRKLSLFGIFATSLVWNMGSASAEGVDFGLSSPSIVKADWESNLLRVADFNGDGRTDFVTVNNAKSLLQLFLQERTKKGEDLVFKKRELVLEHGVSHIQAGDFNGDGRADLALASRDEKLLVRYQGDDGSLKEGVEVDVTGSIIGVGDLDGDEVLDLIVMASDKVQILYGEKNRGIEKAKAVIFYNASPPATAPILCDLDGNGLKDLVYLDSARRNRVLVRFQSGARQWGLESGFEITNLADLAGLIGSGAEGDSLMGIDSNTREMRLYRFDARPEGAEELPLAGPYFLSSDSMKKSDRDSLLACDLTGNGRVDLLSASPRSSEMSLYVQNEHGDLETRTAESLSDIVALGVVRRSGDEGVLLFSLSDLEETVGVSAWDGARGLSVPQFLDSNRKPLAMTCADVDGSGMEDLVYLFKDEKSTLTVAVIPDPKDTKALRREPILVPIPGDDTDFEPVGMIGADVNGDGRSDLLVFSNYYPLRLLLQEEGMKFKSFATDQGMKKGVFNKVRPANLSIADLDGDGKNEMLIAREGFVRAYRIDGEGNLELAEQFNGKNGASRIASAVAVDLDGSGSVEVVLLDSANAILTIYKRSESGDFELARHHDIKGVQGSRLLGGDLNGDGLGDLAIYEGDRVQLFFSGRVSAKLKTVWRRAPEDEEGQYARLRAVRLLKGSDGGQVVANEGTDHLLEFFRLENGGGVDEPKRFFHFKLFDDENSISRDRSLRGVPQPRGIEAADVDGDGVIDLITLMHDNIVYYRQKAGEK